MRQSIKNEGGTEKHIDKFGDVFTGVHFKVAVERGVNEANLRRLFGKPGKPRSVDTIKKWIANL